MSLRRALLQRAKRIDIQYIVLMCCMCPILCHAQSEKVCSGDAAIQSQFVGSSLSQASEKADPTEVLETLACIAQSEQTKPWIASGAVRAIFHIATDNNRIQEYLLDVIRNPETSFHVSGTACGLIVSVADQKGEQELLRIVKDRWSRRQAFHEPLALAELGSLPFLSWIEQRLDKEDLASYNLETWAKQIRLQHNLADLLKYIESNEVRVDRGWLVCQAVRHGVDRNKLRSAVINFLRRKGATQSPASFSTLVGAADWCGVLTPDDAEAIEAVRLVRNINDLWSIERKTWPTWATLGATKRAAFFRASP